MVPYPVGVTGRGDITETVISCQYRKGNSRNNRLLACWQSLGADLRSALGLDASEVIVVLEVADRSVDFEALIWPDSRALIRRNRDASN